MRKRIKIRVFYIILATITAFFLILVVQNDFNHLTPAEYYPLMYSSIGDHNLEIASEVSDIDYFNLKECFETNKKLTFRNRFDLCDGKFYTEYTVKHGVEKALAHIKTMLDKYPDLHLAYHLDAHAVGYAALRMNNGDIGKSFAYSKTALYSDMGELGNGYYHGLVEEYGKNLSTKEEIIVNMKPVCNDLNTELQLNCFHGLGHLAMMKLNYDLNDSLSVCDVTTLDERMLFVCRTGVFMEYQLNFNDYYSIQNGQVEFDMCKSQEKKYQPACYYQHSLILHTLASDKGDMKKVMGYCSQIKDSLNRLACIKQITARAIYLQKYEDISGMCQNTVSKTETMYCTAYSANIVSGWFTEQTLSVKEKIVTDVCHTLDFYSAYICKKIVMEQPSTLFVLDFKSFNKLSLSYFFILFLNLDRKPSSYYFKIMSDYKTIVPVHVTDSEVNFLKDCHKKYENLNYLQMSHQCEKTFYEKYTREHGIVAALSHSALVKKQFNKLEDHQAAHAVGHAALKILNGDIGKAFSFPQEELFFGVGNNASGYYHGLVEEFAKNIITKEGLINKLKPVCDSLSADTQKYCLHGVGHAALIQMDYNLEVALDICNKVSPTQSARFSCKSGVFMEYYVFADDYVKSEDGKIIFPVCDALAGEDQTICYFEISVQGYGKFVKNDSNFYYSVMDKCSLIDNPLNRLACIKQVVYRAGFSFRHGDVKDFCSHTNNRTEKVYCTSMFALRFGSWFYYNPSQEEYVKVVYDICSELNFYDAIICKKLVFLEVDRLYNTQESDLDILVPNFLLDILPEPSTHDTKYYYSIIDKLRPEVQVEVTKEEYQWMKKCKKGASTCADEFYENYTVKHGVSDALSHIVLLDRKYPDLKLAIHAAAHGVGHGALKLFNNDIVKAFNFSQNSLFTGIGNTSNGYYHGLVEQYAKDIHTKDEFVDKFINICNSFDSETEKYCLHGVGHAALIQLDYDVQLAVSSCEAVADSATKRFSCFTGIFMEYYMYLDDYRTLKDGKIVFTLCESLQGEAQVACYFQQAPEGFRKYIKKGGNLYLSMIGLCSKIENHLNRLACVKQATIHATVDSRYGDVYGLCKNTKTGTERVYCTAITAIRIGGWFYYNPGTVDYKQAVNDVCNELNPYYAYACKQLVFKEKDRLYNTQLDDLDILNPVQLFFN